MSKHTLLKYDFSFPEELIAQKPASPRDSARVMVYDKKQKRVALDIFKNLDRYLPSGAVLVMNETKVIPARLEVRKETGGKVKILFLNHDTHSWQVLSNKKIKIGEILHLDSKLQFTVKEKKESIFTLEPNFSLERTYSLLDKYGETPIPPYIKHSPLSEKKLRSEYQAVFAKTKGSVAAPTASLHFTNSLIKRLEKQGIQIVKIVLHVGLGTFAPVTEAQIKNRKLHTEYYEISSQTAKILNEAKRKNQSIIPVGTTALRALESAARGRSLKKLSGETSLFIQEGYRFKFIDGLITNFHVPRSSLLMLVSALASRKEIQTLYRLAIDEKFRLFSFGDGMLIY